MNEQEAEYASDKIIDPLIQFNSWLEENAREAVSSEELLIWRMIVTKWRNCINEISTSLSDMVD